MAKNLLFKMNNTTDRELFGRLECYGSLSHRLCYANELSSFQIGVASFFLSFFFLSISSLVNKHMYTVLLEVRFPYNQRAKRFSFSPRPYDMYFCNPGRTNACFCSSSFCAKKKRIYLCICMGVFCAYALSFVCNSI